MRSEDFAQKLQEFEKILHSREVSEDSPRKFEELGKILHRRGVREMLNRNSKNSGRFCILDALGKIADGNSRS